ncbi:hypothetical protein RHGRI_020799 [Rhododendron griersonianum]|uniref:Uncharacterized protein n=1 Tax=Rhododendron griersonianum TaxID=479676 RepID=A0AAV6JM82_9ERIC|nr:hypothetical protein RHGRI_020799 [Rhododendron griersonianum]
MHLDDVIIEDTPPSKIAQENHDVEGSSKTRARFGSVPRGLKAKHPQLNHVMLFMFFSFCDGNLAMFLDLRSKDSISFCCVVSQNDDIGRKHVKLWSTYHVLCTNEF